MANSNATTVGEIREWLSTFPDDAPIGVILGPYGGNVVNYYAMKDFEDEGIVNPYLGGYYPTLVCGPTDD